MACGSGGGGGGGARGGGRDGDEKGAASCPAQWEAAGTRSQPDAPSLFSCTEYDSGFTHFTRAQAVRHPLRLDPEIRIHRHHLFINTDGTALIEDMMMSTHTRCLLIYSTDGRSEMEPSRCVPVHCFYELFELFIDSCQTV